MNSLGRQQAVIRWSLAQIDAQTMEIASLVAGHVRRNPGTHGLMMAGAYLLQELLNAVLPGADFDAFTGRIYPLERCIIVPRYAYEIVTLCGDLISITIELDNGNLPVFHLGMDDISPLDKLVQQKVHRVADAVHMLPHKGECHRANCMLASYFDAL